MTKSRKSPKSQILLEKSPIKIWTVGRFKKSYTHGFRFQSSQNFFEGSSMCFTENIKMCWRDFDLFQLLDSLISPYQIQIRQIPMLRLSFFEKRDLIMISSFVFDCFNLKWWLERSFHKRISIYWKGNKLLRVLVFYPPEKFFTPSPTTILIHTPRRCVWFVQTQESWEIEWKWSSRG